MRRIVASKPKDLSSILSAGANLNMEDNAGMVSVADC